MKTSVTSCRKVEHEFFAFTLPGDWFENYSQAGGPSPLSYQRIFHTHSAPCCEIFILYRGMSLPDAAAESFELILQQKPHLLTPSKLKAIREVLGNFGNEEIFKPMAIRTIDIDRRTVLCIEGRWSDGTDVYALLFPRENEKDEVIELHFQAPKAFFSTNILIAKAAMATIRWKRKDD